MLLFIPWSFLIPMEEMTEIGFYLTIFTFKIDGYGCPIRSAKEEPKTSQVWGFEMYTIFNAPFMAHYKISFFLSDIHGDVWLRHFREFHFRISGIDHIQAIRQCPQPIYNNVFHFTAFS